MVTATETGSSFTPVPEGGYTATCIRVIDLGTQKTVFNGETKLQHKVLLAWEIPEVEAEDKDGQVMPALIFKSYTVSLHEKATLRQHLESWRGKKFTPDELKGFDLANLLGKSCLMQVVHNESNGSIYANIQALMALPKGMKPAAAVHPLINFDLQKFGDGGMFELLSPKLQERIQGSPEYQAIMKAKNGAGDDGSDLNGVHAGFDPDDEIPF